MRMTETTHRATVARIALLGGTFDPPHFGHLALAHRFAGILQLDELVFLPAGRPWQKPESGVSAASHRLAMVQLAVQTLHLPDTKVTVSAEEIDHHGPTYTVNTLAKWRKHIGPHASLSLLIGADQLASLDTWHNWRMLFEYAHFCVAPRTGWPSSSVSPTIATEIATRRTDDPRLIRRKAQGLIMLDTLPPSHISATQIRQYCRLKRPMDLSWINSHIPNAVWHYICQHHLYQT